MSRPLGYKRPPRPHLGTRHTLSADMLDELLDVIDLRPRMPPVYDQGDLGSCTANAIAGAVEYLLRRDHGDALLPEGVEPFTPSRLAIYRDEREIEGSVSDDAGAVLSDGLRACESLGFAPEDLWAYDIARFAEAPPAEYERAAAHARLINWEPLAHDLTTLRWELANGHAIVFGATVFAQIENAPGGRIELPGPGVASIGGHAMVIVGHSRTEGRFAIRNSWGPSWGDAGYGSIPESYILDPLLTGELHAVRAVRVRP